MRLCSACLLGVPCRYDGQAKPNSKVISLLKEEVLIPVCPEQLGGLPTPRGPFEILEGRVVDASGQDFTAAFKRGASETLKIAEANGINEAILKQGSPSCGCGRTYDGSFSGRTIVGDGMTAALLKRHGIRVITEEEI